MAIFRARGGSSFTTSPAITSSPALGVSKPAIMRRREVFRQPGGRVTARTSHIFGDKVHAVHRNHVAVMFLDPAYFYRGHAISYISGVKLGARRCIYISFRSRHFSQMRLHSSSASLTASSGLSTPCAALAKMTLRTHSWQVSLLR